MHAVPTQYRVHVHILIKPQAADKLILPAGYLPQHLAIALGVYPAMRLKEGDSKAKHKKRNSHPTNSPYLV